MKSTWTVSELRLRIEHKTDGEPVVLVGATATPRYNYCWLTPTEARHLAACLLEAATAAELLSPTP